MTKTIQQINYAVQRHNTSLDDWDTIRETITPLEARARRLIGWKRSLRTRCEFRLVKLETRTTITPIEIEPQGLGDDRFQTSASDRVSS